MEDEESRDVVADLQSELEEREHQLQMAAEFGQGLVEKNSALEEENDELRQENAACLAKVEETEWRFRELEATVARLNEMLQEKQVALERAEGELEAQAELMRQVDATASKLADAHASHAPDADASAAAVGAVDAVGAAAAAEGKAQRKQQLDTEAEQAILEETERRLQAEQSAMKLRQTLERREEELSNRDAKVAEAVAERDELSEKTVAERERCRALQVRLAEMERQLMAAIATSEASTAASGAHTLDMSLAGAAADDSIAGPSLLDEVQDGSTLQLELEDAEMAQPTPRVPRVNSPQRSRAIASPVVAATVEQLKQPPPQPAPPSRETIALQGMLAAVQRSQQQAESLVATENAQEWEGLSELFAAALNLNLTDEYGISIMKRNIERGTHTINHFMDLISGWLEKWAEEEAEKRRQKQKHDGKWAELEELWKVAKELDLIDQGTVDIQRRNINSTDHKKKRFDLDFYISLWHKQLTEFAAKERERVPGAAVAEAPHSSDAASATAVIGGAIAAPAAGGRPTPSPVAALVTANVRGSAPPAVAIVTPQQFELARRNLTEAVAPSFPDPAAIALVPSGETAGTAEAESGAASVVSDGDRSPGPDVVSSPCSPSSPPGVDGAVSEPEAPATPVESVRDTTAATAEVPAKLDGAEGFHIDENYDSEGFLIDENYAKEQLQNAVVGAPPPPPPTAGS